MSGSILTGTIPTSPYNGLVYYQPLTCGASFTLATYSTPFTLEMYIYPLVDYNAQLFSIGLAPDGENDTLEMQFGTTSGSQQLYYSYRDSVAGPPSVVMTTAAVAINKWNHVAWVSNGTTMTAYLNGVAGTPFTISSVSGTSTSVLTDPTFNYGFLANTSQAQAASFIGYSTNVRYVNGTALYNSNFYPPLSPLLAVPNTQLLLSVNSAPTYLTDSSIYNTTGNPSGPVSYSSLSPFNAASLMWVGI
jgi:hypothetical protein